MPIGAGASGTFRFMSLCLVPLNPIVPKNTGFFVLVVVRWAYDL